MLTHGNLLYNALLDDCRLKMIRLENPLVQHMFREQNSVTDAMAKYGVESNFFAESRLFKVPSMCARKQLCAEIMGTTFEREVNFCNSLDQGLNPLNTVFNPG